MRFDPRQREPSRLHPGRSNPDETPPRPVPHLLRDPLFWLAVLAGPLVWGGIWLSGGHQYHGPESWWTLALVALLYPIIEEILFRGFLQGWLWRKTRGRRLIGSISLANVLTATVFALAHVVVQPSLLAAGTFAPGLVFGFFRDRYGGILPGTLLHCFYNTGWFLLVAG